MNLLEDWTARCAEALGVSDAWGAGDRDVVLDLTRDVAHGVARPAAPLTSYLLGIAVGRGVAPAEAVQRVAALLPHREPGPGPL